MSSIRYYSYSTNVSKTESIALHPNIIFVVSNTLICWPVARLPNGSVARLVSRSRSLSRNSLASIRLMALWP